MSQPVYDAYPNYVIKKPDSSPSSGNYGPCFIVLGVIVVLAVVSCVVGHFCNRQHQRVNKEEHHHAKEAHSHVKAVNHHVEQPKVVNHHAEQPKVAANKPGPSLLPREEPTGRPIFKVRERNDVELGFDRRNPSARVANNGGGMVAPPHYEWRHDGGDRPQVRFADNI
ncbi:hypothetical protein ACS0TY_009023 [Phlomoides rotata]